MARALGDPHVPRDDSAKDLVAEVMPDLFLDLPREAVPPIEHREQQALECQARIEGLAYAADGVEERAQSLEGVVLALQRDENAVGRAECVHREETERRRTVDQHERVPPAHARERFLEPVLAFRESDELDLGSDQVAARGQEVEPLDRGVLHDVPRGTPFYQQLVRRAGNPGRAHAEPRRGASLGIEIDEERRMLVERQCGAEVDGRRRLPHPTLLVGHRDRPTHQPLHPRGRARLATPLGTGAVYHTRAP